jgi:hypothetical protein
MNQAKHAVNLPPHAPADPSDTQAVAAARPITLADLTDDLLWPRLFRAAPLALRPERLGIAIFVLVLLGLLGRAFAAVTGYTAATERTVGDTLTGIVASLRMFHPFEASLGFIELALGVPAPAIREHPWWAALFALPVSIVLAVGGGAISRMAANEFAHSVMLPWPKGLGFALSRWFSLAMALLAPLLVAALFVLGLAVGGWLLLNWPVVNVVGALIYPLFLIVALLVVLLLVGYALGHFMLVPAMVCEGTDAIDAVQRSYAYVVGRPLRLIVYTLVLALQLAVMTAVLGSIASWVILLSESAATSLAGDNARLLFDPSTHPEGSWAFARRIIAFWTAIPTLLVGAFVLSFVFSGSTVLYLLMRQLNDGQDPSEIWMPGMIGGTMAQATPLHVPTPVAIEDDDSE